MFRLFVLLLLLLSANLFVRADDVIISDAWIAEGSPTSPVNAAYLQIENTGTSLVTLVAIDGAGFERIEMHRSRTENGMATMEHISRVDIGPGYRQVFAPGDFHLMLYNTGKPPQSGETRSLNLHFANGTSKQVHAEVRKLPVNQHHQHDEHSGEDSGTLDRIKMLYQHLLPQHFLSGLMYRLTRISWAPIKDRLIRHFIQLYNVDMSIAIEPAPEKYRHFNEFFTRPLKASARPVDMADNAIVSPVDAAVSQYGQISNGKLIQAKNRDYTVEQLLGGDSELAQRFSNGEFITLYLSPRDYHRIHMPVTGTLQSMTYVPGQLFSVSPATTRGIDNLFARNERLVQIFDSEIGSFALVMVGAIFVGSMETVWAGQVTPAKERTQNTLHYPLAGQPDIQLAKGSEMGRFNMGSTVILLFQQGRLDWDAAIRTDTSVRLGQKIATINMATGN